MKVFPTGRFVAQHDEVSCARGFLLRCGSRPFIVNVASEQVNRFLDLLDLLDLPQGAAPRLATALPEGHLKM
jgi:hypothetical protein